MKQPRSALLIHVIILRSFSFLSVIWSSYFLPQIAHIPEFGDAVFLEDEGKSWRILFPLCNHQNRHRGGPVSVALNRNKWRSLLGVIRVDLR